MFKRFFYVHPISGRKSVTLRIRFLSNITHHKFVTQTDSDLNWHLPKDRRLVTSIVDNVCWFETAWNVIRRPTPIGLVETNFKVVRWAWEIISLGDSLEMNQFMCWIFLLSKQHAVRSVTPRWLINPFNLFAKQSFNSSELTDALELKTSKDAWQYSN